MTTHNASHTVQARTLGPPCERRIKAACTAEENNNADFPVLFHLKIREVTLLISSYINSAHQQKAAAHHLSAPALMVAQPVSLKSKELRSKSPPAVGRPSKAPTLLWLQQKHTSWPWIYIKVKAVFTGLREKLSIYWQTELALINPCCFLLLRSFVILPHTPCSRGALVLCIFSPLFSAVKGGNEQWGTL